MRHWTQVLRAAASRSSCSSATSRSGVIVEWHPFERRGTIREDVTGTVFEIPNARAFETVMPTMHRDLTGAAVRFEAVRTPEELDRVITRNRLDKITSESYRLPTPVDFLAAFRKPVTACEAGAETPSAPGKPAAEAGAVGEKGRLASSIVVDITTPVKKIPSASSSASPGEAREVVEAARNSVENDFLEGGVIPAKGIKDIRNQAILSKETMQLIAFKRKYGDEARARAELEAQERKEQANAVVRTVLRAKVVGFVLTWSSLHRSGIIVEGDVAPLPNTQPSLDCIHIIRNVECFLTALPTSLELMSRKVEFTSVQYDTQPSKLFAEDIVVVDSAVYQQPSQSTQASAKEVFQDYKRQKLMGTHFYEDADADGAGNAEEAPATGPLYGVITRWSGGQGIIETGNNRLYYVESAADFLQLVDHTSNAIRGAVVSFNVDASKRRFAREISILSVATKDLSQVAPMLTRRKRGTGETTDGAAVSLDEEPSDVEWSFGVLVSWSPQEDQGIIHGDDENRYLLRDAKDYVIQYATRKHLLKKGRKVKFTTFGATRRLACNLVPLEAEADAAELGEGDKELKGLGISPDGSEEAIASPMSTAYWIDRMDKAGYDTTEVKQLQGKALTLEGEDDDQMLDSEDLFKQDHWYNDPRKNKRLPGSEVTAGNLALIGPASLMNIAMKTRNPQQLEKVKNKYYNRLSEPMKEFAWQQAKEMAPKYEKRIKEAQERGEEPRFTFF